jgi:flavin-dependent thymidylate synthase
VNIKQQIIVELQEWMGSDKSIAEAAWTSSYSSLQKQNRTKEDIERVINLLADSKHSVPFESVIFRFWIKLPITADRQHMTHRIASQSGMSGRYRTMPAEWLAPPEDVKSILLKLEDSESIYPQLAQEYNELCEQANIWYQSQVEFLKDKEKEGIITNKELKRTREFLRGVLPQNNMTERVTVINLRSFSNYIKLRNSEHAQPEIQQVAQLMLQEVINKNICPIALKALQKNNWII